LEPLAETLAVSATCLLLTEPLTEDLRLEVTDELPELELEDELEEFLSLAFTADGGLL